MTEYFLILNYSYIKYLYRNCLESNFLLLSISEVSWGFSFRQLRSSQTWRKCRIQKDIDNRWTFDELYWQRTYFCTLSEWYCFWRGFQSSFEIERERERKRIIGEIRWEKFLKIIQIKEIDFFQFYFEELLETKDKVGW